MNKLMPYSSTPLNFFRDFHFPKSYLFASIIDRIKNNIKPGSANALNNQCRFADIMIILADDDSDDRELFEEAILEISSQIKVRMVEDGFQLMHTLKDANIPLPDILFLDLNMPGKTGKQCLKEIKKDVRLKKLPVVIYSTSSLFNDINDTHAIGANYYLQKPNSFKVAVALIKKVFSIDFENLAARTDLNNFVLSIERK